MQAHPFDFVRRDRSMREAHDLLRA